MTHPLATDDFGFERRSAERNGLLNDGVSGADMVCGENPQQPPAGQITTGTAVPRCVMKQRAATPSFTDGFLNIQAMMRCKLCGCPTMALIAGNCLACDEVLHPEEAEHATH